MKDLGALKYFLGVEVSRSKQGLFLSQQNYMLDLLAETGNSACKLVNTPIEINHGLFIYSELDSYEQRKMSKTSRKINLSDPR